MRPRQDPSTSICPPAAVIRSLALALKRCAFTISFFAEPTSAAVFAGLERLVAAGEIGGDDLTLVAITGFGLKDEMPG